MLDDEERRADKRKRYMLRKMRNVEVPAWVPDSMRPDYRELAAFEGEEVAASKMRARKATEIKERK